MERFTTDNKDLAECVDEIVKRIVSSVDPEQVILFGSAARGEFSSHSDIDILVVKQCKSRREVAGQIYQQLIGVGRAVDVVVATPEDLKRFSQSSALVVAAALREGKSLYAA